MVMKNIYLLLVSVFLLSGCSGFLDTDNLTQKNSSNFPANEEDMRSSLTAAYAANTYCEIGGDRWKNVMLISECMADYTLSGGGLGDRHVRALAEYKQSAVNFLSSMWRRLYSGVTRANFILETADQITWSGEESKNKVLGEAYFLRANFYFDLVRAFENVPLVTSTDVDKDTPQAEPSLVFQLILSDFKKAVELLPSVRYQDMPVSELGHATKWAAEGMLARAYLYYSGVYGQTDVTLEDGTALTKQEVIKYVDDCIANSGHGLISDFRNLWPYAYSNKDYGYAKENGLSWIGETGDNIETMFAYKYSTLGTAQDVSYGNGICLFYGIRGQETMPFGKGWGWATANPKLYKEWPDEDLRKKGTLWSVYDKEEGVSYKWNANRNYNETGYFNKKYMPINVRNSNGKLVNYSCELYGVTPNFQYNNTQDVVILRFADVLLMGAELGGPKAQAYLDQVRSRVNLPSVPATLENIKKERLYELAYEGVRYYDLMRWGDLEKEVNRMKKDVPVKTMGVDGTITIQFRKETRRFLPIPEDEIQLSNGSLVQNPGWDTPDAFYQD